MTDAEKLAIFDRVVEIIDRQAALEAHMISEREPAMQFVYRRENAYKDIAEEIKGVDFRLTL